MRKKLTEPFGKAGLTVAILALVMALVGGAYAAGGLTKSQEKQVTKIAKKYAGKSGAPGATGPAGTNGTNGTNGKDGAPGAKGENGTDGTDGENGKSVVSVTASGCTAGGFGYEIEGSLVKHSVCNGEEGEAGEDGENVTNTAISANPANAHCKEGGAELKVGAGTPTYACTGSPWTAGGTLPANSTEEGAWAFTVAAENNEFQKYLGRAGISFGIPLASEPTTVLLKEGEGGTTECPGTAEEPKAKSGFLCVYTELAAGLNQALLGASGSKFGAIVGFTGIQASEQGGMAFGSWAVTG
jgi:hypothetical protein